eukprot:gb/GEZN01002737.1/.p1 GENE.gb/GEZN01002737.1/~~gb/GEZN01002737.1/.p1  ORF type:complete len:456 (-),score=46.78 gb/GEZN01002737.1/:1013-2194(-)
MRSLGLSTPMSSSKINFAQTGLMRTRSASAMVFEAVACSPSTTQVAQERLDQQGLAEDEDSTWGNPIKSNYYNSAAEMRVPVWLSCGSLSPVEFDSWCGLVRRFMFGAKAKIVVSPETIMGSPLLACSVIPIGLCVFCYVGLMIFNFGLQYGLQALASDTGSSMPSAYKPVPGYADSPKYSESVGTVIILVFSFMLGCVATLAEPALIVLGIRVESLTKGRFKAKALTYTVSVGVGAGLTLGVCKVMFAWPLLPMILVGYAVTAVLTIFSTESFVSIAWDCAGVTTGVITVPLVLAVGVSMGNVVGREGFGILALASVCPIATFLAWGLITRYCFRPPPTLDNSVSSQYASTATGIDAPLSAYGSERNELEDVPLYTVPIKFSKKANTTGDAM